MFKVEDDDQGMPLHDVWFYGISAKRYVLYDRTDSGEVVIRKYSSHGLGENLLGLDQEQFWRDILAIHYQPYQRQQIMDKYGYRYAVYDFKVSSYPLLQRFKIINDKKPISRQIKPFNFITIGMGYRKYPATGEPIIPILPHVNPHDPQFHDIPYRRFIDYKTGEQYPHNNSMDTRYYWKPLSEVISDYMEHPESKSEGDIGLLKRRYITINEADIRYIGKESNQLEQSEIIGVEAENYTTYEDPRSLNNKILALKEEDAHKLGISARTLYYWKNKVRENKSINIKNKIVSYIN